MHKRFTDTDKWAKPWFRKIPVKYKCFWMYILDKCTRAGIWEVDFELVSFMLGEEITRDGALKILGDLITESENGDKWLINKFISFQYGELNKECRPHKPIYSEIYSINDKFIKRALIGYSKGIDTLEDKDNTNTKTNTLKNKVHNKKPTLDEVRAYIKEKGYNIDPDKWYNFYTAKGWKIGKNNMKDWKAAVRTWIPDTKKPEGIARRVAV